MAACRRSGRARKQVDYSYQDDVLHASPQDSSDGNNVYK